MRIFTIFSKSQCASIYFDVNGPTLPNKFGQDAFLINVYKDKIASSTWAQSGGKTLNNILAGNEKLLNNR